MQNNFFWKTLHFWVNVYSMTLQYAINNYCYQEYTYLRSLWNQKSLKKACKWCWKRKCQNVCLLSSQPCRFYIDIIININIISFYVDVIECWRKWERWYFWYWSYCVFFVAHSSWKYSGKLLELHRSHMRIFTWVVNTKLIACFEILSWLTDCMFLSCHMSHVI